MQVNKQKCSGQDGGTGGRKQCCVKLELFICHACHKDVHLECLQRTRTVDRQEREDILDSEVNWRCADCVSSKKIRPSAILEEFSQIHGKERILLIRWSGYEMAEDSLTHKNHLETDYTGLQAQRTRRRTERSRRRQDRYGKSVLACKYAPMGVKKISEAGHTRAGPNSRKMEERGRG